MTRRELREKTFRALFMHDFHNEEDMPALITNYLEVATLPDEDDEKDETDFSLAFFEKEQQNIPEKDKAYIAAKVEDISSHTIELDASINDAADGWTCERMNKVDLTLLRLALYEMRIEGLDAGIAINEAVELAKVYGEDRSPAFVNGVLGKLA